MPESASLPAIRSVLSSSLESCSMTGSFVSTSMSLINDFSRAPLALILLKSKLRVVRSVTTTSGSSTGFSTIGSSLPLIGSSTGFSTIGSSLPLSGSSTGFSTIEPSLFSTFPVGDSTKDSSTSISLESTTTFSTTPLSVSPTLSPSASTCMLPISNITDRNIVNTRLNLTLQCNFPMI